jgi:DNA replication protein DnaC
MNTTSTTTTGTTITGTALTGEAVTYQRLRAHLAFLKLPAAAEALPGILDLAREEELSALDTLERVLAVEVDTTHARRLAARLRFACLPTTATLEAFDFTAQPGVDEKLIRELASLRFLDDAGNVLFVGPPSPVLHCAFLSSGCVE